ncbi:IS3 family transposase [Chloroflexota bacterium]
MAACRGKRWHPSLSVVRQRNLLDISRSGLYYQPVGISQEELILMKLIDRQYLAAPFYGARRMAVWLSNHKYGVNRKRVHRLVRHEDQEYSDGKGNRINGLEGFWGYLKRMLAAKGGIRREQLPLYLTEYVWWYNHRKLAIRDQINIVYPSFRTRMN